MADAKKCDICGGFYMRDEFCLVEFGYGLTKNDLPHGLRFLDLCPECKERLGIFVESLKKEKQDV